MSKKTEFEARLKDFHDDKNLTSESLNVVRTEIFDAYRDGSIINNTKIILLKELYDVADSQDIFYMRVTDKKPMPMPEEVVTDDEDEEYSSLEEEESYS